VHKRPFSTYRSLSADVDGAVTVLSARSSKNGGNQGRCNDKLVHVFDLLFVFRWVMRTSGAGDGLEGKSECVRQKGGEKVAEKTKKYFFIKRTGAHLNHFHVYLNIEKELIAPPVGLGDAVKGWAETRPLTRGEEKTEDPPSTSPQHSPHIMGKKCSENC
jgi:hypothetical protein